MKPIKLLSLVNKFSRAVKKMLLNKTGSYYLHSHRLSEPSYFPSDLTNLIGVISKKFDFPSRDFTLPYEKDEEGLDSFINENLALVSKLKEEQGKLSSSEVTAYQAYDKVISYVQKFIDEAMERKSGGQRETSEFLGHFRNY